MPITLLGLQSWTAMCYRSFCKVKLGWDLEDMLCYEYKTEVAILGSGAGLAAECVWWRSLKGKCQREIPKLKDDSKKTSVRRYNTYIIKYGSH